MGKNKIKNDSGMKGLIAAIRQLEKAKRRARALGIFTDDRELLECSSCGLLEDVTAAGILVTYSRKSPLQEDSGLRFKEIDEKRFECPACKATVRAENDGEIVVRERMEK